MNQSRAYSHDSVSHDFYTYGLASVELARVAEKHRNQVSPALRIDIARTSLRRTPVELFVGADCFLAGTYTTSPATPGTADVEVASAM